MIADVLFEARLAIERYLKDMPEVYADMRTEVEMVCAAMGALQAKLDVPFPDEKGPGRDDGIDLRHDCICTYWRGGETCDCGVQGIQL